MRHCTITHADAGSNKMFVFRICPFEDVSMVGLTEDLVDSFVQVNISY